MLPSTGMLASGAGGWPSVFYVSGAVALIWVFVWCLVGANSPAEHRSISETEQEYIISSLSTTTSEQVGKSLCTLLETGIYSIINKLFCFAVVANTLAQGGQVVAHVDAYNRAFGSKLGFHYFIDVHAVVY